MQNRNYSTINRPSSAKKHAWLLAGLILLIVVLGGLALYKHNHKSATPVVVASNGESTTVDYSTSSKSDNTSSDSRKSSPTPSDTLNGQNTMNANGTVNVQITGANVNSGNVHIGTLVSGSSKGTCTLTATKTGQSTIQLSTSSVTQDVNSYSCGVFNIPTSKFTTSGTWQLHLVVSSGTQQGSGVHDVSIP